MNDFTDPHTPAPDFRASLEREIARAYRAELLFASPRGARVRRLGMAIGLAVGAVLTLTIGLVLGASTGYASAEVLGARERAATATSIVTKRHLATVRLELARLNSERVHRAFESGGATREDVRAAQTQVDSMEANVARANQDLGASDSARIPRPAFALLRSIPMRNALTALTCGTVASATASTTAAQDGQQRGERMSDLKQRVEGILARLRVPVVDLPAASARTAQTLGGILGIHQIADGKVLVNDAARRQLKLFDSTLAGATIVMDTTPGSSRSYGSRPTPLVSYVGDSSLFADWNARTMLVLDGRGQVARALALPSQRDLWPMNSSYSGADGKGRLIYRGTRPGVPHSRTPDLAYSDSLPLLRSDLELRRVDTIGRVSRPLMKVVTEKSSEGQTHRLYTLDPLQSVDDWAVLSNGSIAIVRGSDYHIDWIHPDGTTASTPKIPYDWKRLTDEDKGRLVDSVRAAQNALLAVGYPQAEMALRSPCTPRPEGAGGEGRGGRSGGAGDASAWANPDCTMVDPNWTPAIGGPSVLAPRPPLLDLFRAGPVFDYFPAIRVSSTIADLDENLWILPRTSSVSQKGELVYDVVNSNGEMFQRVRVPLGRAIVGFGKGGVVYMASGDITNGFYLERTRVPTSGVKQK